MQRTKLVLPLLLLQALLLFIASPLFAEGAYTQSVYDFPLVDAPGNFTDGIRCPTMRQSANLTKNLYGTMNEAFLLTPESYRLGVQAAYVFADLSLFSSLPGGFGWVHEEGHRAILSQYGMGSYDEVNDLHLSSEIVSVSHVKDRDLERLKDKHPADMVRLSAAGIENEYHMIRLSREDHFFSGKSPDFARLTWFSSILNSSYYLYMCNTSESDRITEDFNGKERTQKERDFTGMDFTAWVYDLYRPDEPYSRRGKHPLGSGYDRYIKRSDLTAGEKSCLRRQAWLSLLNFVSPQLYSFESFDIETKGGKSRFNFAFAHYLTSFGSSSEFHLMSAFERYNLVSSARLYQSEKLNLPGAQLSLYRYKFDNLPILFDASCALWLQPKDQMFHEGQALPGIASEIKCVYPINDFFEVYTSLRAKSEGWVEGEESLAPMAGMRAGVQMLL